MPCPLNFKIRITIFHQTTALQWYQTNRSLWHLNLFICLLMVFLGCILKSKTAFWFITTRRIRLWRWFRLKVAANLNFFIITYEIAIFHMKLKWSKVLNKFKSGSKVPPMWLLNVYASWAIGCFVIRNSIGPMRMEKTIWILSRNYHITFCNQFNC